MNEREAAGAADRDAELEDKTALVKPLNGAAPTQPAAVEDATVVVPRRRARPEPVAPEATVVVARPRPEAQAAEATVVARPSAGTSEERQGISGSGFSSGPGEIIETEAPGHGSPARAVYGARPVGGASVSTVAEGASQLPEVFGAQQPLAERSGLPSLARRFKRRRLGTLFGYAGALLVSVAGLIVIARLAFI